MRINLFLAAAIVAAVAVTGCKKDHFGPGGRGNGNDNKPEEVKIVENPDWTVTYEGRDDYEEEDGTVSRVEEFRFKYTGSNWFIVRSVKDGDLEDNSEATLRSFFKDEAKAVVDAAGDGKWNENNNNVFTNKTVTVYFDLLFHGDYTTYMIELNAKGGITGKYAKHRHEVKEEEAEVNFSRWLGDWKVGDGDVFYSISISSAENNYFYYVDGWETGKAVVNEMSAPEDWIFARYDKTDGNLHFYGQFVCAYEDKDFGDVDEMFVGTYLTPTEELVDDEGAWNMLNIAYTKQDVDKFTIEPEILEFDNGSKAAIKTMRYSRYAYKDKLWYHYNTAGVPTLPLTMTALPASAPAKTHRMPSGPAVKGKHMQRGALKVHTPKTAR